MLKTERVEPREFPWVQALRAVAALAVAFVHTAHDATAAGSDPTHLIARVSASMPWAAGVDIFFVISGFIIVHASAKLFANPGGAVRFFGRRLSQIVPLYWLLTTLFLMTMLLQRSAIHGDIGSAGYILASYLFLPWLRPDGVLQPPLGLGWTLNYEMFFYCVLTPFILLPRTRGVLVCAAALCLLVALRQSLGFDEVLLQFWSDPIILEFVLGMMLALAVASGLTLPDSARLAIIGIAFVTLHMEASGAHAWRVISYGLPGAMLVAAAVSARRSGPHNRPMRVLMRLGDASYALYLVHPFIMRFFTLLGARLGVHSEASGIIYVLVSLATAQVSALWINAAFERKMIERLRRGKAAMSQSFTIEA